jgi:hypothetical protein
MMAVWKYPIAWPPADDRFSIVLPPLTQVLAIQVQHGIPCVWALVDPTRHPVDERWFRIAGTGHEIADRIVGQGYIGTFQLLGGSLVLHVFEVQP